jgi:hypothetical protein
MPASACTGIDTASSWAAWCRSRSGWVLFARPNVGAVTLALLFGLFSVIYGVSQIVTETELRRTGKPCSRSCRKRPEAAGQEAACQSQEVREC